MISAGRVLLMPKGAYNPSTTYEILDIVSYNGSSYIAKGTTTGNLPTDTTYWQLSAYGGQASNMAGNFAELEVTSVASMTHYADDIFVDENSQLMRATQTINIGDTIDVNTNCTPTTVEALITSLSDRVDSLDSINRKLQGAIEIAAQTDLHSLALGEYYKSQTSFYVTNAPDGIDQVTSAKFRLTVEAGLADASQASSPLLLTLKTPDGKIYAQGFDGTIWGSWEQIAVKSSLDAVEASVADVETSSTASKTYAIGKSFYYDDVLYKATAPIPQGGTITPGTNCTPEKIIEKIDDLAAKNQTLTKNVDVLIENGSVNKLPNNAVTQTINGVTFTVNTDPSSEEYGAVTITTESGGSTALTQLILFEGVANWHNMVLSGAPSTASATTYDLSAYDTQTSGENSCRPNDVVLTNITDGHTIRVFIRVRSGQVITEPITFKPMIADANYTGGYIPYAKTNRELTKDDSGLTANAFENGCVNILPNKATSNTYTAGGANLTVVVDKDKNTITANGMTGSTPIYVEVYYNASGLPFLKNGKKYILSGAPSGVPYTDAYLFINKSPEIASSNGNSKEFTFDSSVGRTTVSIIFAANKTFTNAVFKPMITVGDLPNSDYAHSVPHAMTNRELTEKLKIEEPVITPSAGITIDYKHCYKIGNTVFLNFRFLLGSTATVATNAVIATVDKKPKTQILLPSFQTWDGSIGDMVQLNTNGTLVMPSVAKFAINKNFFINACYITED